MIPIRTHPRSTIRSSALLAALATCFALACARSAPRTGTVEPAPQPVPVAARDSARPAPAAVDSTAAARRAPVADTQPAKVVPEPVRPATRPAPEPRLSRGPSEPRRGDVMTSGTSLEWKGGGAPEMTDG